MQVYAIKGRSGSNLGIDTFASGIGVKYTKDLAFNQYAKEVMAEGAKILLKEQRETLQTYYNRRTGTLESNLDGSNYSIMEIGGSPMLVINYLLKIRFLDMKKTSKGKNKKLYAPIYNRLVWGFVFGRIYKQLRYGFTQEVRNRYTEKLREIYKQPI
jgi:hypothetical protein